MSLSAFLLSAAQERARQILAERELRVFTARDWNALQGRCAFRCGVEALDDCLRRFAHRADVERSWNKSAGRRVYPSAGLACAPGFRRTPMIRFQIPAVALVAAMLMAATGHAVAGTNAPVKTEGSLLVGVSGMTLYTFDTDVAGSGKSACNGPCAQNWPPLPAADADRASGDYSIVTRDDGTRQWAYKGRPLYFWAKDTKPGDTTGDGVKGAWRVARP
jgi:predicted lipoprotein with Yx(FWY)xxD motif